MKKILLLLSVILFSTNAFASFPVKRINVVDSTTTEAIAENSSANMSTALVAGDSQVAALLLCFFLGALGIHRFYLGDTWQGIVQLLTLGGFYIWSFIDFIMICTGDLGPGW